jgi:methyl-accepting chemotaxis protein
MERNRDIAVRGVADALRLSANVKSLGAGANQIGSVVGLIAAIAAQTNLLALNAAIEAARAGPAGRGFAVIAGEVKALAGQTELATRDISAQITALQAIANGSILEVKSISATIREMETEMRSISELASKQSAATALIYGDAAEVSTIAEGTMTSAGIVKNAVGILHETTGQARDLAKQLRSTSVELDSDIGDFVGWLAVT